MSATTTVRWGIAGVGVAGRARARAIHADPRATLVAGWRGRPEDVDCPRVDDFDALLGDDIDAVAVCTPDDTHPALVRRALAAGKHVVCEFPLAGSAAEAATLFAGAAARDLVLHVEHIELLSGAARWLRARRIGRRVLDGSVRFRTKLRPDTTSIAHANVARLHRLLDVFGPVKTLQVRQRDDTHLVAHLTCAGPDGWTSTVELDVGQEEGAQRRTEMSVELDDGVVVMLGRTVLEGGVPVTLPDGPGLFAADHGAAMDAIRHGIRPYVEPERVLAVLDLADRLMAAAPGAVEDVPHPR